VAARPELGKGFARYHRHERLGGTQAQQEMLRSRVGLGRQDLVQVTIDGGREVGVIVRERQAGDLAVLGHERDSQVTDGVLRGLPQR
jgi:hypothetical protein